MTQTITVITQFLKNLDDWLDDWYVIIIISCFVLFSGKTILILSIAFNDELSGCNLNHKPLFVKWKRRIKNQNLTNLHFMVYYVCQISYWGVLNRCRWWNKRNSWKTCQQQQWIKIYLCLGMVKGIHDMFCETTRRMTLTQILPEGVVQGLWNFACGTQLPNE